MSSLIKIVLRGLVTASLVVASLFIAAGSASAATWHAALMRYPYLTDVTTSSVQVTWADTYRNTYGTVTWGVTGSNCATSSLRGATLGTSFTVAGAMEYQHSITISGLAANTKYCYRVKGGSTTSPVDLLGTDPSPTFSTLPGSGSYSYLVFGDWGDNSKGFNTNQSKLNTLMAQSGARFAIGTGDIAYTTGTQNQYGDLVHTGTNVSQVFGPDYWRKPGAVLPFFSTPGNHGRTNTFFQIWPEAKAAAETGESYKLVSFPGSATMGYSASTGPGVWYAFDVANTRHYVLTADWSDTNVGSADGALCRTQFPEQACPDYQAEADAHWTPSRPQYQWLAADLAANSSKLKLAYFHYPLRSDDSKEPSDIYLQNSPQNPNASTSLEKLLYDNKVKLAFNGHAHIYQRNVAPPGGVVSYVTGGGGAGLVPIAKGSTANCATTDAYGLGWSSTGGSYCGAAGAKPASASKVYHYLKVTVNGNTVTVEPTNADGEKFDTKTYNFGSDSTPPTAPSGVQAKFVTATKSYGNVTWTAGSDSGSGVAAYDVYRAAPGGTRAYLATVTPDKTSYNDYTAVANTAYTYSVDTRDQAGNIATGTAPPIGTADGTPPTAPGNLSATATSSTSVSLSWTASSDFVGVTGYDIYRGGVRIAGVSGSTTTYTDLSVSPSTTYDYFVRAKDAANNWSPDSNTATVTTPAGQTGQTTLTFAPAADARVEQANPTISYGTATTISADMDSAAQLESYLKFDVTGLTGTLVSAKLRLWTTTSSTSGSVNGPAVYGVRDVSWTETSINWSNKPAADASPEDNKAAVGVDTLVEYDVTALINAGDAAYAFKVMPDSTDGVSFNSRQGTNAAKRPQLVLTSSSSA